MTMPTIVPNGSTLILATVGDPIAQAVAPTMMSQRFAEKGVNALWLPIAASPDRLETVFAALRSWTNFAGLSITVPHKSASLDLVDRASRRAQVCGAINVARREADGSLYGDVVDGAGFISGLRRRRIEIIGRDAQLVGAGGAGSAIAASLCEAGIGRICLMDVDGDRVASLAARLAAHYPTVALVAPADMPAPHLAINATPIGMQEKDPLPFDPALLPAQTLICDIIMHPAVTPLLARAQALGMPTQPGLPMLEAQADLYLEFFGFLADT